VPRKHPPPLSGATAPTGLSSSALGSPTSHDPATELSISPPPLRKRVPRPVAEAAAAVAVARALRASARFVGLAWRSVLDSP